MSILIALSVVLSSIVRNLMIYFVGRILSNPEKFRAFLGIQPTSSNDQDISKWVRNIGYLLIIYAISSVISTIVGLFNFI